MKRGLRKRLRANKRRIAGIVAVALAVLMLLGAMAPFLYVYGATESAFEIESEVGFSQRYVVSGVTPVKLYLKNNGEDFKGEVQIKINVSDDLSLALYNVYAHPVELPQGSSTVVDMNIVIPTARASHKIILVNEKDNTVAQRVMTATAIDPESVLMGALTEQKNSLNYLRQIAAGENTRLGNNLIPLDEKSFPNSKEALSNFDVICVNDFDTSRLSQKQHDSLDLWLRSGGILMIGTGQNYDKVMRGLDDIIPEVGQTGSQDMPVPEAWIDEGGIIYDLMPMRISRLKPSDVYAWEDDGAGLTYTAQVDGGMAVVHCFDLGTEPIPQLNEQSGFLTGYYTTLLEDVGVGYDSGNSYNRGTEFLINNLPAQNSRVIMAVFIVTVIYGVFIGPFLYLILKKKDRREKGLVIIPFIATSVSLLILLLTSQGIYQNPIVNTVNFVRITEGAGSASAEINAGVFSPKKGDVKVDFSQDMPVSIADQYSRYYDRGGAYLGITKEENQSKILYGQTPTITYYDKASWDTNTFASLERVDMQGGLRAEFYLEGKTLKGELVNETGLAIHDVIVGIGHTIQKYDVLLPGERLPVSQEVDLSQKDYSYADYYSLFQWDSSVDLTGEEKRKANFKQNIIGYFYENRGGYPAQAYSAPLRNSATAVAYSTSSKMAAYPARSARLSQEHLSVNVMGFNYDKLYGGDIKVNGKKPTMLHTNFLQMQVPLSMDKTQNYDLPFGIVRCHYVSSDVNFETHTEEIYMYEKGDAEFVFALPTQMNATQIQFQWDTNIPDEGREIWNESTKSWEALSSAPYRENVGEYVDREGCVRVRILGAQEFVPFPLIGIKGGR